MIFTPTPLAGAFLVDVEPRSDERGAFARTFCATEFAAKGLNPVVAQTNLSSNRLRGTVRGLHYQRDPHGETKLIRVVRGAIFDVIVDLRPGSETYRRWYGAELSASTQRAMYAPVGFAHGFQTLTDDVEIHYVMGAPYVPDAAAGVRFDDPVLGIPWPETVTSVSPADRSYPLLEG